MNPDNCNVCMVTLFGENVLGFVDFEATLSENQGEINTLSATDTVLNTNGFSSRTA
jgi:hypothetical protein